MLFFSKESLMSILKNKVSNYKLSRKNINRYYPKTWRRLVLGEKSKYRSRHWCLRNRRRPDDITLELLKNAHTIFLTVSEDEESTNTSSSCCCEMTGSDIEEESKYDSDVTEHSSQVDCSDVASSEFDGLSDLSEELEDEDYSEEIYPSERSINYDDIDSRVKIK